MYKSCKQDGATDEEALNQMELIQNLLALQKSQSLLEGIEQTGRRGRPTKVRRDLNAAIMTALEKYLTDKT